MTERSERPDAEFIEWVAGWLDRLDPILQALYSRPDVMPNPEDRAKVVSWLDGKEVQERLRRLAPLAAERDRYREALELIAGPELYPRTVALAALAANHNPTKEET